MSLLQGYTRCCLGLLAVAAVVSACGSGDSRRKARGGDDPDGGNSMTNVDSGNPLPEAAPPPDAPAPPGPLQYIGSSGPAGGIVMRGGGYILFSVTGEVPGTSGLSKSPGHKMVGGVVGRASY